MPMLGPWITKRKIMYLYSHLKVEHKLYDIIHYENIEKKHTQRNRRTEEKILTEIVYIFIGKQNYFFIFYVLYSYTVHEICVYFCLFDEIPVVINRKYCVAYIFLDLYSYAYNAADEVRQRCVWLHISIWFLSWMNCNDKNIQLSEIFVPIPQQFLQFFHK